MTFQWNPNAVAEIKKVAARKIEVTARRSVETTVCPDHGKSPKLVRHGDALLIEDSCCKKVAELAAKNARLGTLTWHFMDAK